MAKEKDDKQAQQPRQDQQRAQPKPKKEGKKAEAPAIAKESGPKIPAPPARLATYYKEKVVPDLMKQFGYKTVMQVPRINKITINMGVGETVNDKKVLDFAVA